MINPDLCHERLIQNTTPRLSYGTERAYDAWRAEIRETLIRRMGFDLMAENACEPNFRIEWEEDRAEYRLIRFLFDSEVGETVPCYLVIPKQGKKKYPVAITMQGHSTGFHNSIGVKLYPKDEDYHPRGQFALQAARNGFVALAIEQRGMGERKPVGASRANDKLCRFASVVALELGRTLLAERVWDIARAIDLLDRFEEADTDRSLITGKSGGGTISYYAACLDERIKLCVPSCAFCPYPESIMNVIHCNCNYIPGAYRDFDMQDLACLIAPRPFVAIAGVDDPIFPLDGVKRGMETVKSIYANVGAEDSCRLVVTPEAHWWCEDLVWSTIEEECKKLGWS